ncbi:MAG: type I secretion system permease/ATPase [Alphaproteobacteria bacterium]
MALQDRPEDEPETGDSRPDDHNAPGLPGGAGTADPFAGRGARDFPNAENARDDDFDLDEFLEQAEPDKKRGRLEWLVRPTPGAVDDPLSGCLSILATLLDRPMSVEALTAGLPMAGEGMTPDLFVRAAARAGISARLARRPLARLNRMALPCVLLLRNRRACVLTAISDDGVAHIILPEMGVGARKAPVKELETAYDGYTLFAQPEFRFDERSDEIAVANPRGWFWGTLLGSWRIYIEVVVAALLINAFALAGPLFVMNVYDRVVPNFAEETLWVLATGLLIVYAFDFVLKMLRGYFVDAAGRSADTRIAGRLFRQVLGMKMADRPGSTGALASSMREYETLRAFFTSSSLVAIVDLPFIFLFIFIVYIVGGPLAIVPLVAAPVVMIVGLLLQIPLRRITQRSFREAQQRHALLVEAIGGIETVKSTGAEGRMQRNWESCVETTARSSVRAHTISALAMNFSTAAASLVSVGVIIYGVYMIDAGLLSVGALVAATILAGRAMALLGQVAGILSHYHQARASLRALDQLMRTPVERPFGRSFVQRPDIRGEIEFRNVTFRYPGQDIPALDNVSFRIEAGEKVGLIGRIGSGKSTIQRLAMALYEPSEGLVLVDGTDVRQIDPADLRRSIGSVPQDVYLFFGSIRDNIAIGAPDTDDETIRRAARIAGVDEFASRHPSGYDMPVGERGQFVSAGQRQSVAIARALLRDPPILLFDEPTSNMDHTSEGRFRARLANIIDDRTLLLVTHRESMLSLVDRLIVVDGGRVVADGPKQDVLDALPGDRIQTAWG